MIQSLSSSKVSAVAPVASPNAVVSSSSVMSVAKGKIACCDNCIGGEGNDLTWNANCTEI